MLRRTKGDWFSIVATDLFCNILCAVIILDAVTPKETSGVASPVLLELASNRQSDGSCPDPHGLVLVFSVESGRKYSTLDFKPLPIIGRARCSVKYFLPGVNIRAGFLHLRLIVSEFNGTVDAAFRANGGAATRCSRNSNRCALDENL